MARPIIVLKDESDCECEVIEASPYTRSGNKRVARVGDKLDCGCKIKTGDSTMLVDGKAVARDGDKTTCGAKLIASQRNTTD